MIKFSSGTVLPFISTCFSLNFYQHCHTDTLNAIDVLFTSYVNKFISVDCNHYESLKTVWIASGNHWGPSTICLMEPVEHKWFFRMAFIYIRWASKMNFIH